MTAEILHSPPHQASSSSSITLNNNGFHQQSFINNDNGPVASYSRRNRTNTDIIDQERGEEEEEGDQLSVLEALVTVFRKSLVSCKSISEVEEQALMEIGWPSNVRHVAHVTFDRFNGFLGLPVEFEPDVPRRPPSASTRVFGVSTESMQLSFDSRGNCVPTILLMMQRRLYSQGGLQSEGIFRINPENGQEELVREQLNNGLIPDDIDVHCLAGLIKAWFRELPTGVLDSLSPEQVMQAQSEDECAQLVRLLPPTESSLMDWAVNLMADVAQLESFNKMNARNIAVVFAPNMTQMSDPLTALMYAVQVMNFLKTLIVKTMREREDSLIAESAPMQQLEPSDEDGHHHHHSITKPVNEELDEEVNNNIAKEPINSDESHGFLSSIENILHDGKGLIADVASGRSQPRSRRTKSEQQGSNSSNGKKGTRKHIPRPVANISDNGEKSKEMSNISRVNSYTERSEAWR